MLTQKIPVQLIAKLETPEVSKQFVLDEADQVSRDGFVFDPVNEIDRMIMPGVIHKYRNRILLILAKDCFVHCQYCFRQNFEYSEMTFNPDNLMLDFLEFLSAMDEIDEVILSGGDPLVLSNRKIFGFMEAVWRIRPDITIRFHTRAIVANAKRFDSELLDFVNKNYERLVFVFHINHPAEIDKEARDIANALRKTGVTMFCQSVLLKGVNNDAVGLKILYLALFRIGIIPYYLNVLDKASGTERFYVEPKSVLNIYDELSKICSGHVLPKLVQDQGGDDYKRIIGIGSLK